jgi:hypothetical protein
MVANATAYGIVDGQTIVSLATLGQGDQQDIDVRLVAAGVM